MTTPMLGHDGSSDPLAAGWHLEALAGGTAAAEWQDGALAIRSGALCSPVAAARPPGYLALAVDAQAEADALVMVEQLAEDDLRVIVDVCDRLDAGPRRLHQLIVRLHPHARHIRVRIMPQGGAVRLHTLELRPASAAEAAAWADQQAEALPGLKPALGDADPLACTRQRLREGGDLRIVLLGDSIANDTGNSLFETWLAPRFPDTRITVVNSVRGATGCWWYQDDDRISAYVLPFAPDLLVIAGISHRCNLEAMRNVVHQVRARLDTDILLCTDTIAALIPGQACPPGHQPQSDPAAYASFHHELPTMAWAEDCGFVDLRSGWESAVIASGRPVTWYLRDAIHACGRGKQIAGRLLADFLARA